MAFKSKVRTVFIDTQTPAVQAEEMLDVILSPVYYWVKRVELPVKYLREVKKLLPSLFEDSLPEGKYSYTAYRDGDAYMIFAYNDKAILDILSEKGIKSTQLRRLYFAQSEFSDLESAVALGEDDIMVSQEGVVVKLPAALAADAVTLDLTAHKCSAHHVNLERYAHIAGTSSLIWFASFMAVLIVLIAVEWGIIDSKTAQIEKERTVLFDKYRLKSTIIQNEAVLKRLERRYDKQMKIRKMSAALFGVKLRNAEKMTRFELSASALLAEYSIASASRAKAVVAELKRAGLTVKEHYAKAHLRVEMAL